MIRADENIPEPTAEEWEEMERRDEEDAHWAYVRQWEEEHDADAGDIAETA